MDLRTETHMRNLLRDWNMAPVQERGAPAALAEELKTCSSAEDSNANADTKDTFEELGSGRLVQLCMEKGMDLFIFLNYQICFDWI